MSQSEFEGVSAATIGSHLFHFGLANARDESIFLRNFYIHAGKIGIFMVLLKPI